MITDEDKNWMMEDMQKWYRWWKMILIFVRKLSNLVKNDFKIWKRDFKSGECKKKEDDYLYGSWLGHE